MKNRQAAMGFIFITICIDVIGLGIIIPVLPNFIKELIGGSTSQAAKWGGLLVTTYAVMQFLFAPFVGALSDRFGRRPVLLFSLLGFAIDYVLLALAPDIVWLFIGRLISGIMGASMTTATAYIADISTDKNRAQNFGMIGAAFGIGFIIGPVIGGLLGHYGHRVPFWAAAALSLLNTAYGYFVLPESLPLRERRRLNWRRANPIGSINNLRKYKNILGLMSAFFIIYVSGHAVQTNWSYFTIEKFGWTERMIGISLGVVGLLVGLVQGLLVRWINPKIGNAKSVFIGFGMYCIGMLLFAFASEGWMMYVFLLPYCLGGISGPAIQSIITSQVPKNEQGELQGSLTSIVSLSSIIGPMLMTSVFFYFTNKQAPIYFPGASFLLASFLILISIVIIFFSFRNKQSKVE